MGTEAAASAQGAPPGGMASADSASSQGAAGAGSPGTPGTGGALTRGEALPGGSPLSVQFRDEALASGIEFTAVVGGQDKQNLPESTGAGVAIGDVDGDGDEDVFLATAQTREDWLAGRTPHACALYRNEGNGRFTDVAAASGVDVRGWICGAYFADVDNDGDADLFLTALGKNRLLKNDGSGKFTDVTARSGLDAPPSWNTSAAFVDVDRDGDLDLYVARYVRFDMADPPHGGARSLWKGLPVFPGPLGLPGAADSLYRNNGDGTFEDVSEAAGIRDTDKRYGLGVVATDFDGDGAPDIYVANDSMSNFLWHNDGRGRFEDVAAAAGVATNEDAREQAGMGTDAADFDDDGDPDIVVTNFSHDWNTLYRNDGGMRFSDATFTAGFADSFLFLGWAAKFFDFDHDGWLDLFIANGHIYPNVDGAPSLNTSYRQVNLLYRNRGNGSFENVTKRAGPGFAQPGTARGAAIGDLDRDGDLDLVVSNSDGPTMLLVNDGGAAAGHWLEVRLRGGRSNRDGIGARLTAAIGGHSRMREVNPFGSYQSGSTLWVHFGLGTAKVVDTLTVRWPSGTVDEIRAVAANQRVIVAEGSGRAEAAP